MNIAVDERSSPYYALRDRQGNAIGVTACDIDGDGREEIYFLNTNNAFSGKGLGPRASYGFPPSASQQQPGGGPSSVYPVTGSPRHRPLLPPGAHSVPAETPISLRLSAVSPSEQPPLLPHTLLLAWLRPSALLTGRTAPWNRPPCCFRGIFQNALKPSRAPHSF